MKHPKRQRSEKDLRRFGTSRLDVKNFFWWDDDEADLQAEIVDGRGKLYLYDDIDSWYGVGPKDFKEALDTFEGKPVDLYINCGGGDVWDGRAIKSQLERYEGGVTAYVDGICASAATTVAMGAQEIVCAEGTRFMVHNCWSFIAGDKHALRKEADVQEGIDDDIAGDYMKRTGKDRETVRGWMDEETFFSAQEAVDLKLADRIASFPEEDKESDEEMRQDRVAASRFMQMLKAKGAMAT